MGKTLAEPAGYLGLFRLFPEFQDRGVSLRLMNAAKSFFSSKGVCRLVNLLRSIGKGRAATELDIFILLNNGYSVLMCYMYDRILSNGIINAVIVKLAAPSMRFRSLQKGAGLPWSAALSFSWKRASQLRETHSPQPRFLKTDEFIDSSSADGQRGQRTSMDDSLEVKRALIVLFLFKSLLPKRRYWHESLFFSQFRSFKATAKQTTSFEGVIVP